MTSFLTTERLILRPITRGDATSIAPLLQDPRVMYAWEHPFSDEEVREWMDKTLARHAADNGLSHLLALEKETGRMVGAAGLLKDTVNSQPVHEISYMLHCQHWRQGYAREAAAALARHAFSDLGLSEVIFEIRPENTASLRVARALGALHTGSFIKPYWGKGMLHHIYTLYPQASPS